MPDIRSLLWPETVAVIGAADDTNILRGRLLNVIRQHDFPGRIYPVSRSLDEVQGIKAYPSVAELPEPADLAVLIIPADAVPDELERCGAAGVKAALVMASGFAEEPGGRGGAMQDRIREIAARHGMTVSGPNSEGFSNLARNLCVTFSPTMETEGRPLVPDMPTGRRARGRVAVVAQSGGVGFSFYDRGRPKDLAFSHIVTTGNEACIESLDVVDHLLDDDGTDVILMFMEDIKSPGLFAPTAERALRAGKPLVVAKIGRSEAAARAAMSHTAALTGSFDAYRAQFLKFGVIEGRDPDAMVDLAQGFCAWKGRLPAGRRVGIFTASGGGGGWMADACAEVGLEVPELDAATRAAIDPHLPAYGTSRNPVDGTAQVIRQKGYAEMCEMIAGSANVDAVVAVTSARNPIGWRRERDKLLRVGAEIAKPTFFWAYTLPHDEVQSLAAEAGFPMITNLSNCAATIAEMAAYRAFREDFLKPTSIAPPREHADEAAAKSLLRNAGPVLCEVEARRALAAYGIGEPPGALAETAAAALAAADAIDGPVVLKIQSPDITHKTDAGGVVVDVSGEAAVGVAYDRIIQAARDHDPVADILGVLVEPMAADGIEVILGVNRDRQFGPILMLGLGGVHTEILGDTAFAPAPVTPDEAWALIGRLKAAALFDGVRGQPAADVDALVRLIVRLSQFAADHAETVREIDINPVRVHAAGDGVSVLDALIIQGDDDE